eukprot:Skav205557  [mRNA]  locus=scaffold1543:88500:89213:- [translate_table: standard]
MEHPQVQAFHEFVWEEQGLDPSLWHMGMEGGDDFEDMTDFIFYVMDPIVKKHIARMKDGVVDTPTSEKTSPDRSPSQSSPTEAPRRVRSKAPPETKAQACAVDWVPLTKRGYDEFIDSCKGSTQPQTQVPLSVPMTMPPQLHQPRGDLIKWQQIKLGTKSWLESYFLGQAIEGMTLQQLIRYTKQIDHVNQGSVPESTPKCVRDTIWAIGDMWHSYGTDRPDEVQWWLEQGWGIPDQ